MASVKHSAVAEDAPLQPGQPSTCFSCARLNPTTFLLVEDDQWGEVPFIYAKVFPSVLVLIDTGCGGAARDPSVALTSLREFLETYPVPDNDGRPLNPGGEKEYAIVCTHCHYDHIGKRLRVCTRVGCHLQADHPWVVYRRHRAIRGQNLVHMGQLERQGVYPRRPPHHLAVPLRGDGDAKVRGDQLGQ